MAMDAHFAQFRFQDACSARTLAAAATVSQAITSTCLWVSAYPARIRSKDALDAQTILAAPSAKAATTWTHLPSVAYPATRRGVRCAATHFQIFARSVLSVSTSLLIHACPARRWDVYSVLTPLTVCAVTAATTKWDLCVSAARARSQAAANALIMRLVYSVIRSSSSTLQRLVSLAAWPSLPASCVRARLPVRHASQDTIPPLVSARAALQSRGASCVPM